MADDGPTEDYPSEIEEYLTGFQFSLSSVQNVIQTLMSVAKGDHLKLDPLEQAKLDLMSAYTINSLFWMYLVTQGVNPKEHGIKQELERIRTYMNRVKEMADKKKAARLDKGAASRFLRSALWDAEEAKAERGTKHPNEVKDDPPHPSKTKGGPSGPSKTKGGPSGPSKTKGGPSGPSKTKGGPSGPSKTKGGPSGPSKTKGGPTGPSKTKGGPTGPNKAKDSLARPSKAKQRKLK